MVGEKVVKVGKVNTPVGRHPASCMYAPTKDKPMEQWSSLAPVRKNLLNRTLKNSLDGMS